MAKKVTIVIVNYNGARDTLACLSSLRAIDYPAYEIIVVDNASDDVQELVATMLKDFPGIKIVALPQNRGFSGGCNVGIEYALVRQSDYVLLLNNDTTVAPDFLTKLVEAAESDPHIGIAGAKIYFRNEPDRIWYASGEFSWRNGGIHPGSGRIDTAKDDARIIRTSFVTGCTFLIKTEVIRRIKMMPEQYFMYYEDIDWSLSAQKAGYGTVVAHASHVWHAVSASARHLGEPLLLYYHTRNALLLARRHASLPVRFAIFLWSWYFYAKQRVKMVFLPSTRPLAIMIVRGIADFYNGKFGKFKE